MKVCLLAVLCLSVKLIIAQTCTCPSSPPLPPMTLPDAPSDYVFSNEIIDGVDHGTPLKLGAFLFLKGDYSVSSSIDPIKISCPRGYRAPTQEEYQTLITAFGAEVFNVFTDPTGFNASVNLNYITSTKSFPLSLSGGSNDSWKFKAVYINGTLKTVSIKDVSTYWSLSSIRGRCMLNVDPAYVHIQYPPRDFVLHIGQKVSFLNVNLVSYLWKAGDHISTTKETEISFSQVGCALLESWTKDGANNLYYNCSPVYTRLPFGSDNMSSLTPESILAVPTGKLVSTNWNIFFANSMNPVAPIAKGGFYMLYCDRVTFMARVIEFDVNQNIVKDVDLGIKALPIDIVATNWGFVVFVRDYDVRTTSLLNGYNSDFTLKFSKIIMNNGELATEANENQVIFYGKDSKPLFGMNAMLWTNNGKLAYGRGRISLFFAHYNFFGYYSSGSRSQHTGDTFLTFDENGQNDMYAWSWNVSHSVIQSQIYDGRYFVTASLGDYYAENITVCFIDPTTTTNLYDPVKQVYNQHPSVCTNISPDKIPGDGVGGTCGRLGGMFTKGDTYYIVYSLRPCTLPGYNGAADSSTTMNYIALLSFKFENNSITHINRMIVHNHAEQIKNVRAGKYAGSVLITYVIAEKDQGVGPGERIYYSSDTEYAMLVGFDGKVLTAPFLFLPHSAPTSEDLRELSNGQLAWGGVDRLGNLTLYYTVPPPCLSNVTTLITKASHLKKLVQKRV